MPRPRRPYIASLDLVRIERRSDGAVIEYADADIGGVHLTIGPEASGMSDQEILDVHSADIEARKEQRP